MLSRCFLDFSVGVGAFIIGLSQISSFFSYYYLYYTKFNIYTPKGVFVFVQNTARIIKRN